MTRGGPIILDWRRTLRLAARRGGHLTGVTRRPRRRLPPRLVVLWDVSGSMAEYIPFYLPWLAGVVRRRRAAEVIAFGADLLDITGALANAPDRHVAEALRGLSLFGGGTAIGRALETFLNAGSVTAGTIVVIISDGWEGESPRRLTTQLARLRGRTRRVLWLNPLAATPGYQPVQRGIMVAARYADRLLAGATYQELAQIGQQEA